VDRLARTPRRRLTLAWALDVARRADMPSVVANAALLQAELPVRLAERAADLQQLPFIVGCNPHIHSVYQRYLSSIEQLAALPPVHTADDEERFSRVLARLVDDHADVLPTLARGTAECAKYLPADATRQYVR
jgi:hypothetical protein